jgi:hypothetical protein
MKWPINKRVNVRAQARWTSFRGFAATIGPLHER